MHICHFILMNVTAKKTLSLQSERAWLFKGQLHYTFPFSLTQARVNFTVFGEQ